ncbi:hypothetical protein [Sphingomonas soli]|uniref:hypothetical protein n=1 Tax=Sphingomonas soli TaxID=266127 RepID=UPI000829B335|nr:hypothetical protein [Sphingomonas soli]
MKSRTIALLAVSALALAACQNKAEEAPVAETNVTNLVETGDLVNIAPDETPTEAVTNVAITAPAPTATLTADEQTTEDADATGMTARVNRDESGDSAAKPAQ